MLLKISQIFQVYSLQIEAIILQLLVVICSKGRSFPSPPKVKELEIQYARLNYLPTVHPSPASPHHIASNNNPTIGP